MSTSYKFQCLCSNKESKLKHRIKRLIDYGEKCKAMNKRRAACLPSPEGKMSHPLSFETAPSQEDV